MARYKIAALTFVTLAVTVGSTGCEVERGDAVDGSGDGIGFEDDAGESEGGDEFGGDDDGGSKLDVGDGDGDGDGDGSEEGGGECADLEVDVEQIPPTVVLLIDQSGSMDANFSGVERWDAVYETLQDPDNGVVANLDDRVRFGLTLYTSFNGDEGGQCPVLTTVEPGLHNFAAIDDVYAGAQPEDETPTGESLLAVADGLSVDEAPGKKIIVLATDGEPDTCAQPNPQEGQADALLAAEEAYNMGVETRIISVGNDVSASHLQEMANAGRGLDPIGAETTEYYQALDSDALVDAFDAIVGEAISCEFAVNGLVDLEDACDGEVALDGEPLECGVDWEMADESTIVLNGEACDSLKDGEQHSVEASWPCGTFHVP